MRVIISNSHLRSYAGHPFHNTLALCNALQKSGVACVVVGSQDASRECFSLPNFLPYFPDLLHTALAGSGFGKILPFFQRCSSVQNLLKELFNTHIKLQRGDVVLVHSPREFEFLGWSLFLRENASMMRQIGVDFVILTLMDFNRPELLRTLFLRLIYSRSLKIFAKLSGIVSVGTVSELMKLELEKLADLEVQIFPDLAVGEEKDIPQTEDKFIDIAFLGGARHTKGFDLLVRLIEEMGEEAIEKGIRFWLQCNPEGGANADIVLAAMKRLEELGNKYPVELLKGGLSTEGYYSLLGRADMVLLPYRKELYRTLVSGPFVEAMHFGRVPIIPRGTWMAFEAARYGIRGITFEAESISDLRSTIRRVMSKLPTLKRELRAASALWRKFHCAENFVRVLLAGQDPRIVE